MVDWTSAGTRDFWHDFRRQPLIDMGVAGHWTDLGEPEMVHPDFVYGDGLTEAEVHNSYNLLWLAGHLRRLPAQQPGQASVHDVALGRHGHAAARRRDVVGRHRQRFRFARGADAATRRT